MSEETPIYSAAAPACLRPRGSLRIQAMRALRALAQMIIAGPISHFRNLEGRRGTGGNLICLRCILAPKVAQYLSLFLASISYGSFFETEVFRVSVKLTTFVL